MIVIVGGGLFGSVARDLLRANGHEAMVIDNKFPDSGSAAAGCLMKPSWLSCLGDQYKKGLDILDSLYGLEQVPMMVNGVVKLDSIYHVDPTKILKEPDIVGKVERVDQFYGAVHLTDGQTWTGKVLVAAGYRSKELLPNHFSKVQLVGKAGVSLRFRTELLAAKISVWAPYKQSAAFTIADGETWFGDGTSINLENWNHGKYLDRALFHANKLDERLSAFLLDRHTFGVRPYVVGHSGWFVQTGANCWVTTGGAKNGLVLAAIQAQQFLESI